MRLSNENKRRNLLEANAYLKAARHEQIETTLEPVVQALLWHYSVKTGRVSNLRRALLAQVRAPSLALATDALLCVPSVGAVAAAAAAAVPDRTERRRTDNHRAHPA